LYKTHTGEAASRRLRPAHHLTALSGGHAVYTICHKFLPIGGFLIPLNPMLFI
jgi:hypothetical protein